MKAELDPSTITATITATTRRITSIHPAGDKHQVVTAQGGRETPELR